MAVRSGVKAADQRFVVADKVTSDRFGIEDLCRLVRFKIDSSNGAVVGGCIQLQTRSEYDDFKYR